MTYLIAVTAQADHIPGSSKASHGSSALTGAAEPVSQAASLSSDVPLSPAGKGALSAGKGHPEVQRIKRLSRGSSGSPLRAIKLIRASSASLQGATSTTDSPLAPSKAATSPEAFSEPQSEPEAAVEYTASEVQGTAPAAQHVNLGSSQSVSPTSGALNPAEHQQIQARATASAHPFAEKREQATLVEPPLRPASEREGREAEPGEHAVGSVQSEKPHESEPGFRGTAASEDECPTRPSVSSTEVLDPSRERPPAEHVPHSEQPSPSDSSTAGEKSETLVSTELCTPATVNGGMSSPVMDASEQQADLNDTTASVAEHLTSENSGAVHRNSAAAQSASLHTDFVSTSGRSPPERPFPLPAITVSDSGSQVSCSSTHTTGEEPAEISMEGAEQMQRLQEALNVRERQLERKSAEVSEVQAICDQLQVNSSHRQL